MDLINFIKRELNGWGKVERIIFPSIIVFILVTSIYMGDTPVAMVSAVCGISYTILAGKGKISCYYIGLCGTMCYAYLSLVNGLWGNLALYALYYFPMQILGIFKWREHLRSDTHEIEKTRLSIKDRFICLFAVAAGSILLAYVLKVTGDTAPVIDAITTVFSIAGLLLTVKRCIEQWYIWIVVNGLSALMWLNLVLHGSKTLATFMMWTVYFFLGIYFLITWQKDMTIRQKQ